MQWDLGLQGLAVLAAISLGFGMSAVLLVGKGVARRMWAAAITTATCFVIGVVTSEGLFGWATEEELQPNIDGLSRDEVLLSSVITTALVVLAMRYVAHLNGHPKSSGGNHLIDRRRRQHRGQA